MVTSTSRRVFLKSAAIAGTGFLILKDSRSAFSYQANEKLDIALIGLAGRGEWFVNTIPNMTDVNVTAVCDVDDYRAAAAHKAIPKARRYHDYRKMVESEDPNIDAVIIAVPDFSHAPAAAAAMRAGKHVFCEKPLTHDVYEARKLRELAVEKKLVTQKGNQGTSSPAFRRAVELIQLGIIGEVCEVYGWKEGGGAGERPLPSDVHDLPETLKWDFWLGPRPLRSYNSRWMEWHTWREFATNALGNWGSHTLNLPFKALKLDTLWYSREENHPVIKLQTEVTDYLKHTFPRNEKTDFSFPAREGLPPVTIHWFAGGKDVQGLRNKVEDLMGRRLDWGDAGEKKWEDHAGVLMVGSKGMIHANGHNTKFTLLPEDQFKDFEGPGSFLPRSRGHEREWMEAIRGGPPAMSNFNYSGPLAELLLLGNVATQFREPFEYDPVSGRVTNHAEANKALKRDYREGWSV